MTKTITTIWDPATHLRTADDVAAYLEAALQDGDPKLVAAALGDIARTKKRINTRLKDKSQREFARQGVIGTVLWGFKNSDNRATKLISRV